MSTLAVVEQILRETKVPMSVREIVAYGRKRLPTRSRTPDTVVARDLSMDIKKKGEESIFIRTAPGRFTIREIHLQNLAGQDAGAAAPTAAQPGALDQQASPPQATTILSSALREERAGTLPARPAAAAKDEQHTG